jgi:hypothetical protein
MASSKSNFLSVASGHIDSLINYVLDVKPYHTKLSEVVEEYLFEDAVNVKLTEGKQILAVLGPDFLNRSGNTALKVWEKQGVSRPVSSLSAERTVMSDGSRRIFPVPTVVMPKLLSLSDQEHFTVGTNDDHQIPGLLRGVFSPRRWEGPGIPHVTRAGSVQYESIHYHISHGAFSFVTNSAGMWKQQNIASNATFSYNPGDLGYNDVHRSYGTIKNIVSTVYEEFTLVWNAASSWLVVTGSTTGFIGHATFDTVFTSPQVTFEFRSAQGTPDHSMPPIVNGEQFILTPREKITTFAAPVTNTTLDTFAAADGTLLTAHAANTGDTWAVATGNRFYNAAGNPANYVINGNKLANTNNNFIEAVMRPSNSADITGNHTIEIDFTFSGGNAFPRFGFLANGLASYVLNCNFQTTGNSSIELSSTLGPGEDSWGLSWSGPLATDTVHTLKIDVNGDVKTIFIDGVQILQASNATWGPVSNHGYPWMELISSANLNVSRFRVYGGGVVPETWTIIKTNPQALSAAPAFSRISGSPATQPALSIFTRSLEWTPASSWSATFTSTTQYTLNAALPGYPKTVDLINGCSYKDDNIHFTITPPSDGFKAGDQFTWSVKGVKENFLVYGSVSGWQPPAIIGEWYWNGKIGFKIPKLQYTAIRKGATISTSADALSWTSVVVNDQELLTISYINDSFLGAGIDSIVGISADGYTWSSDPSDIIAVGTRLVVIGAQGLIGTTEDGSIWYRRESHTEQNLNGIDVIPTDTALEAATDNLVVVVGDNGTILTSLNGSGWTVRTSGVTDDLNSAAHSDDWIIVVGDNGRILRSQDRIVWTICSSPTGLNLNKVKFLNGAFWAVGDGGVILKSTNGITWVLQTSNTMAQLNDIAYGGGIFAAVGRGGVTTRSLDGGITWTATISMPLNAIEWGQADGVFVTVEHKANEVVNFVPLRDPHSIADPSVYELGFRDPVTASSVVGGTVIHNEWGYRPGFKIAEDWTDEIAKFRIDLTDIPYSSGEIIRVYLTEKKTYSGGPAGSALTEYTIPDSLMHAHIPFYYSHGSVIFPAITSANDGQALIIDKAMMDYVHFRIGSGSLNDPLPPACLGTNDDGWVPLQFKLADRRIHADSVAEFPDLATYVDAYLGSDPNVKVFTISQPRYKTTNRPSTATLTFDETFFNRFLPEKQNFGFRFGQADSYGQIIRVKIAENVRIYERFRYDLGIELLSPGDAMVEGYDLFFYDSTPYDEAMPASWLVEDTDPNTAVTAINDGLTIVVSHGATPVEVEITYDINHAPHVGGVYVVQDAPALIVTTNFVGTQSVQITPDVGAPFSVAVSSMYATETGGLHSFSCAVPGGTAPYHVILSLDPPPVLPPPSLTQYFLDNYSDAAGTPIIGHAIDVAPPGTFYDSAEVMDGLGNVVIGPGYSGPSLNLGTLPAATSWAYEFMYTRSSEPLDKGYLTLSASDDLVGVWMDISGDVETPNSNGVLQNQMRLVVNGTPIAAGWVPIGSTPFGKVIQLRWDGTTVYGYVDGVLITSGPSDAGAFTPKYASAPKQNLSLGDDTVTYQMSYLKISGAS